MNILGVSAFYHDSAACLVRDEIVAAAQEDMRMFGHDPLSLSEQPGSATYWLEARPPRPKEDYFRQY